MSPHDLSGDIFLFLILGQKLFPSIFWCIVLWFVDADPRHDYILPLSCILRYFPRDFFYVYFIITWMQFLAVRLSRLRGHQEEGGAVGRGGYAVSLGLLILHTSHCVDMSRTLVAS